MKEEKPSDVESDHAADFSKSSVDEIDSIVVSAELLASPPNVSTDITAFPTRNSLTRYAPNPAKSRV